MKKQEFNRIGSTDREANWHLLWTIGWAFIALTLSLVSVFHL